MEEEKVLELKIGTVQPGENYRQSWDKAALKEMTASIKAGRKIPPIIVRKKGKGHEVIDGGRRLQATIDAGKKTISAIVREATDAEALELSIIYNDHEDVNPMEQALGFKRLLDLGKHTRKTLAAKLGKKEPYVEARLRLVHLPEPMQKKLLTGALEMGHGLLLTRLTDIEDMKEMAEDIIENGFTVKEAESHLDVYSYSMSRALFSQKDCDICAARTMNQTMLFPEAKATDDCLNKKCFLAKTKEHLAAYCAELEKAGISIITEEKEARRLSWQNKTSCRIALDSTGAGYEKPKKIKQCMACTTNRAFICVETALGQNDSRFETGWICLDRKCLNAMNGMQNRNGETGNGGSGEGAKNPQPEVRSQKAILADRACLDRFLRNRVSAAAKGNDVLIKRLLVYMLLLSIEEEKIKAVLTDLVGMADEYGPGYGPDTYKIVSRFKVEDLDRIISALAVMHMSGKLDPVVLQLMAPEAGVSLINEFTVDEEWLGSRGKDELASFAKALDGEPISPAMKKPDIITAIMSRNIVGHIPAGIAEMMDPEIAE